jgi:hypothetical protein
MHSVTIRHNLTFLNDVSDTTAVSVQLPLRGHCAWLGDDNITGDSLQVWDSPPSHLHRENPLDLHVKCPLDKIRMFRQFLVTIKV